MNKKFVLLIFIIFTLFITYLVSNFNNTEILEKEVKIIETSKIIVDRNMNQKTATLPKDLKEINNKENNQQTHQFHEDSVLDYRIAIGKLENCINYFNPMKSIGALKVVKPKLTKNQKNQVDKYHQYCESIKDKYPYYFSQDMMSGFLQADPNLKALSGFDKFSEKKLFNTMKKFKINQVKPTDADIFDIGSTNAYSIIGAQKSLKTLFDEKAYPELTQIIGGNNKKYLVNIVNHAENKVACDLGANCGVNSNMMINYCRKDESNCGLDFMQMYETRLSRGQQLDVLATESYLIDLFAL